MIPLKVPPLGESIVEATIARWAKKEGESVTVGETLVELETDKITVEVPAPKAGVLTRVLHQEGDVVKVDDLLGELDESATAGAGAKQAESAAGTKEAEGERATKEAGGGNATESAAPKPAAQPAPASQGAPQKVSPAAQRLAAESGTDVSQVSGTGRGGVVSKPDVVEHLAQGGAKAAPSAPPGPAAPEPTSSRAPSPSSATGNGARETREKMTTRRKRIAENLLLSKQSTASLTTFNEVDMTALSAFRDRMKEGVEKRHGTKLSVMPFFVKACCIALEEFPTLNAQLDGESIVFKHYVHMGIAVASDQGLVVPNVKDAHSKSLLQINADIGTIAKRARDGKLTMDDLTGGTFTITNGGVFGSLVSTPIINYPQVGILGMHKIQDRPVAIDGQVVIRPMMYLALSYDHRLVDGQQSVQFLVRVKELLEDPASMLIG